MNMLSFLPHKPLTYQKKLKYHGGQNHHEKCSTRFSDLLEAVPTIFGKENEKKSDELLLLPSLQSLFFTRLAFNTYFGNR